MGFNGGNSGGGGGGVIPISIRIPQARLDVAKITPEEIEAGASPLIIKIFYDVFGDDNWLQYNPKVFLYRYKKRMTKRRNEFHNPKNEISGQEITPAGFAHTENGIDINNNINKITEWNANITLPVQGNGTKRPFYKRHATKIVLKFTDWFREYQVDENGNMITKFAPRGGRTKNTRFSEYFKFCYCIEKEGKIYFGDLSTETIKMRVEKLNNTNGVVLTPILKLV